MKPRSLFHRNQYRHDFGGRRGVAKGEENFIEIIGNEEGERK